ncbi:MAG: sigma-70 family RNA polymerase sigma factor [Magnetospirillum sp.]|nr:sigma-70 family RNA polymerase sigma factor [Magnetospirillum sp.]
MVPEDSGFDRVFANRRRALYALALQRLKVVEDAEDAVQETYLKCLGVEWQSVKCPDAMLTTIHLNVVRDIGRRRARSPIASDVDAEAVENVPSPAFDPEQSLFVRRRWQAVSDAVAALPPVCRKIFLMAKADNLSHADISAATGMSRAAVEKNVVRAMQRLRQNVGE